MARPSGPAVKVFAAPVRGIVRALPESDVPPDALYTCSNVVYIHGALTIRPGFKKFSEVRTALADPSFATMPMGAWLSVTSDSNQDIHVATKTKLYRARNYTGSWTDISGTVTLTAGDTNKARFASLYNRVDGKISVLMANGKDDMVQSLDGGNYTIPASGGPRPLDICSSASRIVGVIYPYKVVWSDIHSSGSWPSLNFTYLLDSPGAVVAIRNLGTQGVAVYKQDAIVAGFNQPGSPAAAFRWEQRASCTGPASAAAVVEAAGVLFHMTPRGRIGMFDGTRFEWIGDGAWSHFFNDFDYANQYQTTGFYDDTLHVVWFIYPRISEAGAGPTGLALISLPRPGWGINTFGVYAGVLSWPVSCAQTMFFTSGSAGFVCRRDTFMADQEFYGVTLDQGTAYNWSFQTGLQPVPDVRKIEIEPLLSKLSGYGSAQLYAVTSYNLSDDGGTAGSAQTVDLDPPIDASQQVRDIKGYNQSGRFIGLKMTGVSNTSALSYKGAIVSGHGVEAY